MVHEIGDTKIKDHIRDEMEKFFGLRNESFNEPQSTKKGRFENTFVQEENSSTSFAQHQRPDSSLLPVHSDQSFQEAENDPESSNISYRNEDSHEPFPNPISFSLNRSTMLGMDKISDDDDYDLDDSSLPSPPKVEMFSPRKVEDSNIEEESMDIEDSSQDSSKVQQFSSFSNIQSEDKIDFSVTDSNSALQPHTNEDVKEENEPTNAPVQEEPEKASNIEEPESVKEEKEAEEVPSEEPAIEQTEPTIVPEMVPEIIPTEEKENIQDKPPEVDVKSEVHENVPEVKEEIQETKAVEDKPETSEETKKKENTEKKPEKSKVETPHKSRQPRDSKSQVEVLLDRFIAEDSKNTYSDCDISDVSSVHSSDLSDYDEKVIFSDSDCEDFNGLELDKLRLAIDDPEGFVDFMKSKTEIKVMEIEVEKDESDKELEDIEEVDEEQEEEEDEEEKIEVKAPKKKESKKKGKGRKGSKRKASKSRKKETLKRANSDDSLTHRRSRRRTISSSTDSSNLSKAITHDTPESSVTTSISSHNTSRKKKRQRLDSVCSTDSSIPVKQDEGPSSTKKARTSRKLQQSYDASDLYKPRTSNSRSNRRSNRQTLDIPDNPQSPLSTASNSTS